VLNFFAVNKFPNVEFLDEMMRRVQIKNTRKNGRKWRWENLWISSWEGICNN
jgi:hypothetical protein